MDGRTDGWMDWMDGWMDGWIGRQVDRQIDRSIDIYIYIYIFIYNLVMSYFCVGSSKCCPVRKSEPQSPQAEDAAYGEPMAEGWGVVGVK